MGTKKAIAKTNGNALAPASFLQEKNPTGGEELTQDDVKTPRIKLAQKTGTHPVEPGHFYNSLTRDDYGSKMNVVVFKVWNSRAKFTDEFKLDCKSEDGIHGSKYGECSKCGFSKWGKKDGKSIPSPCSQGYTYVAMTSKEVSDGMKSGTVKLPALFTLAKSQIPAAKLINSNIQYEKGCGRSSFAQPYVMETDEKTFTKGSAFIIKAQPGTHVADEKVYAYLKGIAEMVSKTDFKSRANSEGVDADDHHEEVVSTAKEVFQEKGAKTEDPPF